MSERRIKNWAKFQHFKDRRPPWIKLYRDLLDDISWHQLPGDAAKLLVELWMIASEDDGKIPNNEILAFRLRKTERHIKDALSHLYHWLEGDDITLISDRYQDDTPETERETERETEKRQILAPIDGAFEQFWHTYPKKRSKGNALKAWRKLNPTKEQVSRILAAINRAKRSADWVKERGQYIPYPATWINAQGWEDDMTEASNGSNGPSTLQDRLLERERRPDGRRDVEKMPGVSGGMVFPAAMPILK